jgi:hypothetical protein
VGLTGKYNFRGIQGAARTAIKAAIAATTWGASWWFKLLMPAEDLLIDDVVNWLANEGLIVLNLGAIVVNGEVDQALFDKALDDGLRKVEEGRDKLSAKEGRAIDQQVIAAARRFIDFGAKP